MIKLLIFGWHGKFRLFISKISIRLNYVLLVFFFRTCRNKMICNMINMDLFSYSFCPKLIKIRLEEVCTWTKNRNINIFRKDYAFMPITQNWHFSLSFIYNPSLTSNTNAYNNVDEGTCNDLLMPYILHINSSSNYHISNKAPKQIQK